MLERKLRHLAVKRRRNLVMSLHRSEKGKHLTVPGARFEYALVAGMDRVGAEIWNPKTRGQHLQPDVHRCEVIVEGVIGDEHVGARLLFAARKVALFVM